MNSARALVLPAQLQVRPSSRWIGSNRLSSSATLPLYSAKWSFFLNCKGEGLWKVLRPGLIFRLTTRSVGYTLSPATEIESQFQSWLSSCALACAPAARDKKGPRGAVTPSGPAEHALHPFRCNRDAASSGEHFKEGPPGLATR